MLCFRLLYAIVLSADVFDARARVCVCVFVVHWHCTAQLRMFNMEKRFRNKIIIIIITTCLKCLVGCLSMIFWTYAVLGSGQNSHSVRELDNPTLHSLLLPCRSVGENQRLGC